MLYLLCFFGFDLLYLFLGAMYVVVFNMYRDQSEWDNTIWLLWPLMAWRRWRLHRFNKYMNAKWER